MAAPARHAYVNAAAVQQMVAAARGTPEAPVRRRYYENIPEFDFDQPHAAPASTAPPNPFVGYALPPHIEALRAAPRMRVTVKRAAGIGFGLKIHGGINTALEVFKIKGCPSHVRARSHSAHCGPQALFLEAQRTWLASVWTMCLWPLTESRKISRASVAFQH